MCMLMVEPRVLIYGVCIYQYDILAERYEISEKKEGKSQHVLLVLNNKYCASFFFFLTGYSLSSR